jgi:methylation protein EvaC
MPIANGFLTPQEFSKEYFFELATGFCSKCGMVQLIEQPQREKMFHENYAFFSSTSAFMKQHFKEFAEQVMQDIGQKPNPFVMEIGSNDGIMLQNFAKAEIHPAPARKYSLDIKSIIVPYSTYTVRIKSCPIC